MMTELDSDAQQRRETFAHYGLAMYHAQCVEKSLAILVSSVFNKKFLLSSPDQRERISDEVFAKTIGQLVKHLRKQIQVPDNLDENLEECREKRNWLAHEYFWVRAGNILTSRGRAKMIDELSDLTKRFSKLDAHLTFIYMKWAKKAGIQKNMIDENLKELIKNNE